MLAIIIKSLLCQQFTQTEILILQYKIFENFNFLSVKRKKNSHLYQSYFKDEMKLRINI